MQIKYTSSHDFAAYFVLATIRRFIRYCGRNKGDDLPDTTLALLPAGAVEEQVALHREVGEIQATSLLPIEGRRCRLCITEKMTISLIGQK